jgi:hypothetical protein
MRRKGGISLRWPFLSVLGANSLVQNRRIGSGPGSQLVALPSMAAVTPKAGMMLHCGK